MRLAPTLLDMSSDFRVVSTRDEPGKSALPALSFSSLARKVSQSLSHPCGVTPRIPLVAVSAIHTHGAEREHPPPPRSSRSLPKSSTSSGTSARLKVLFCVKWITDGTKEGASAVWSSQEEGFQEERQVHRSSLASSWISAAAPHSTVNVNANNSLLDPCSSGTGTVQSFQKHVPECSSITSLMTRTEHGSDTDDYMSFNQFDVVQDFSDHHYAKHSPGKTTKDWVKTIQNEWRLLQKDLPGSIYVRVYEDRIDLLRVAIVGPAGTPYHDSLFFFDIRFPAEYPRCPPKAHYHSGGLRLNPNLYESGKVCLSLLNTWWGTGCERWSKSNSTILQVLVSIQGLVLNDKPYFNEPGNKNSANTAVGEKNSLAYNQTAFLLSCKTMVYSLRKPPKHFETLVVRHFNERECAILDACGAYMSGTVVGSSVGNGTKYPCDKCFADFKRSLKLYTEHLTKELAANRTCVLEPKRDSSAADEIVSTSQNSCQNSCGCNSPA